MVLLVDVYYDFSCQDLPPAIEDSHEEFFGPGTGWFQALLLWDPIELPNDVCASIIQSLSCDQLQFSARGHDRFITCPN